MLVILTRPWAKGPANFANFSDAPDALGHRELPVVKISALNDPWRYQKRQKKKKKIMGSEFSFS